METVYKKRLLHLADIVETIPVSKFEQYWLVSDKKGTELCSGGQRIQELYTHLGWWLSRFYDIEYCKCVVSANACMALAFPNHFELRFNNAKDDINLYLKYSKTSDYDDGLYNHLTSIANFFGVSYGECNYLFIKSEYRQGHCGPHSVAKRIRKFAKDGKIGGRRH